ncbi:MAG: hypothetical protein ABI303_02770 [Candidatus Saccharimonas sp.]
MNTVILTEMDILNFYQDVIVYRFDHKDQSAKIAEFAFDRTHSQIRLHFPVSAEIDSLRYEFGSLEAPGAPDNDTQSNEDYENEVWLRLSKMVDDAKEKMAT